MLTVTPRALDVLRRGFEAARLDPSAYGVRLRVIAGSLRTSFDDAPQEGEESIVVDGIRLFVQAALARGDATIDVTAEHDTLTIVQAR